MDSLRRRRGAVGKALPLLRPRRQTGRLDRFLLVQASIDRWLKEDLSGLRAKQQDQKKKQSWIASCMAQDMLTWDNQHASAWLLTRRLRRWWPISWLLITMMSWWYYGAATLPSCSLAPLSSARGKVKQVRQWDIRSALRSWTPARSHIVPKTSHNGACRRASLAWSRVFRGLGAVCSLVCVWCFVSVVCLVSCVLLC